MTLVIMAAGFGSRFGGLKQVEPVGPNNEFIIDYSIYDAKKAGFNKVVFIIKEENYEIFKETISKRLEGEIDIEYVFQKLEDIPNNFTIPDTRKKPWGTTHAILSCRNVVNTPFAVINADDYYGQEAYIDAMKHLLDDSCECSIIGYKLKNTITENGTVSRGICQTDGKYVTSIAERKNIRKVGNIIEYNENNEWIPLNNDSIASMNFWTFKPNIFKMLEEKFEKFILNLNDNSDTAEALLPIDVGELIKENKINVELVETNSDWCGVTYKTDKEKLVKYLKNKHDQGKYPEKLWKN